MGFRSKFPLISPLTYSLIFTLLGLASLLPALVQAQALPDFTGLVERNAPAIVNVSSASRNPLGQGGQGLGQGQGQERSMEDLLRYFFGDSMPPMPAPRERNRSGMGSGFIIDSDGYVVTNHHVVNGADDITVTLNDRREFSATLLGSDESSDLALLKIEASGLPAVELGVSENLRAGEWVLAIGSPFGLSYSVSAGIVSYIGRNLPDPRGGNYVSYIQTDVAINPGNSGGPLFNLDGEVVGINSQIFTNSGGSIGLSFAIPVDVAKNVIAQLRDKGSVSRGWMGVAISDVDQETARVANLSSPKGALVNEVISDSPAEAAGFQAGDIIVAFNGREIRLSGDLPFYVGQLPPGSEADVSVVREGETIVLGMTVGDLDVARNELGAAGPALGNPLGLVVSELERDQAQQLGVENGLLVDNVNPGPASEAGIQPGDVIVSVSGRPVLTVADFAVLVSQLPPGELVPVLVARDGEQSFFTLRMPQ